MVDILEFVVDIAIKWSLMVVTLHDAGCNKSSLGKASKKKIDFF